MNPKPEEELPHIWQTREKPTSKQVGEAERQFHHKPRPPPLAQWPTTARKLHNSELLPEEQRIWTHLASQLLRPASKMRPSNPQLWKSMNGICIHQTYRTGQTEQQFLKGSSRPTLLPPRAQHRGSLIETAVTGAGHKFQIMRKGHSCLDAMKTGWKRLKSRWLWEQSGHWPLPHYTFTIILKITPSCANSKLDHKSPPKWTVVQFLGNPHITSK